MTTSVINETENTKIIKRINETNVGSQKRSTKSMNFLASLTREKKKDSNK